MRKDFEIIISYIERGSKVLDLGCSDGELLERLIRKGCWVRGIEKDFFKMNLAMEKNIPVFLGNMDFGLDLYEDGFFDYVILSSTIQQLDAPHQTIEKMLLKGSKAIVSFTNYGYYLNRSSFLFKGRKPRNEVFQKDWYDTSDIHPLTIADFEKYCDMTSLEILDKHYLDGNWKKARRFLPNLFAGYAIYLVASS